MERVEQQQDQLDATAQYMVDFRSRVWEAQPEDKGGKLVAIIFVAVVAVLGVLGVTVL